MSSGHDLVAALRAAGAAYAAFIEGLDAASFHRKPADDGWSAAELTGHVSEFPRTFALDAARLAANPGAGVGRNLDDEGRLAALGRVGNRRPEGAAALVRATMEEAAAILGAIPADGWAVEGVRVVNGEAITAAKLVEMFVVDHLRLHLEQARQAAGP